MEQYPPCTVTRPHIPCGSAANSVRQSPSTPRLSNSMEVLSLVTPQQTTLGPRRLSLALLAHHRKSIRSPRTSHPLACYLEALFSPSSVPTSLWHKTSQIQMCPNPRVQLPSPHRWFQYLWPEQRSLGHHPREHRVTRTRPTSSVQRAQTDPGIPGELWTGLAR